MLNKATMAAPRANTFLLPAISAALPTGTKATTVANIYDVATHPSVTASAPKYWPMAGSAMFTVDIMKGPRNEAAAATKSTVLLKLASVKGSYTLHC